MKEQLDGTNIELVESPGEGAPVDEAAQIRQTLARQFPAQEGARRTFRIVMNWSELREAWIVKSAEQRLAEAAWSDRASDVAQTLALAGHCVEVERRGPDQRRSIRRFVKVPVHLNDDNGRTFEGTAVNISAHGATVLTHAPLEKGSHVRLTPTEPTRGETRVFSVVWAGEAARGVHKLGLEMLDPSGSFWGAAYQPQGAQS